MKKIFILFLSLIFIFGCFFGCKTEETEKDLKTKTIIQEKEVVKKVEIEKEKELKAKEVKYISNCNKEELEDIMADIQEKIQNADTICILLKKLNYKENECVYKLIVEESTNYNELYEKYLIDYNAILKAEEQERIKVEEEAAAAQEIINAQYDDYYVATTVWYYLKDLGYNDYIAAGIIGNMMAECGGQTLNLIYDIDSGTHYGLCQWSKEFSPNINGGDLTTQCNYLANTISKEFNTFGFNYYNGFDYDAFLNITNERDAAMAFACCYERCSSSSYAIRQTNATVAYEYYVG